jgi:hypothetical protein
MLAESYDAAKTLLDSRRELLAARLLDREKVDTNDQVEILGPRPQMKPGDPI